MIFLRSQNIMYWGWSLCPNGFEFEELKIKLGLDLFEYFVIEFHLLLSRFSSIIENDRIL